MKVVFVFFLFVVSMFSVMRSLYLKLKKSIPVFNVTVKQPLRNWSTINRVALLAICLLLINFSIVFGSGLHFQWYFALLVAQYICFLILDRFFIAVSYSKVNIKDLPGGKQLYIIIHTLIGYFYIVSRVLYFFLLMILFPYSLDLMGRPVESLILDDPFGKYDSKEQKMAKSKYLFGDAINIVARYEKYSFFDNELIVYDCNNQAYFFRKKYWLFMAPMNDLIDFYHIDANELNYDKDRRILFFNRSDSAENEGDNEEVISSEYVHSYTDTPILRVKISTPKTPDSLITRIEYRNDSFFYYKYATKAIVKTNFAKNKEGKVIQIDSANYKTFLDTVLHL